jgi:aminoglycoside phosphotransferase (APT) family kinase protein
VAMRRATGFSPLLEAAAERVNQAPMPQGGTVLVHGDLWQGNTLWTGERCMGMVDWDAAGVGHPGIDLSRWPEVLHVTSGCRTVGPRA